MEQRSHFIRKLPMPVEVKEQYPLTEAVKKIKIKRGGCANGLVHNAPFIFFFFF